MRSVVLGFLLSSLAILVYVSVTPAPKGVAILEYHMVDPEDREDAYAYNVPPEEFRMQLDYLQRQGYTTITMLEFMKAKKGKMELPQKPIVLTFDDGYDNNYTYMLPILEEHGMKATIYMVTNDIGRPGYLTWDQLREMQDRGVEIGSHTANHLPLTGLSREEREDEMRLSKLLMEWNGIRTVFSFSYPNGAYDETMPKMLRENEYLTAVTGEAGLNTFQTNPYLMHRVNIPHPRFGLTEFKYRLWKAEAFAKLGLFRHEE